MNPNKSCELLVVCSQDLQRYLQTSRWLAVEGRMSYRSWNQRNVTSVFDPTNIQVQRIAAMKWPGVSPIASAAVASRRSPSRETREDGSGCAGSVYDLMTSCGMCHGSCAKSKSREKVRQWQSFRSSRHFKQHSVS